MGEVVVVRTCQKCASDEPALIERPEYKLLQIPSSMLPILHGPIAQDDRSFADFQAYDHFFVMRENELVFSHRAWFRVGVVSLQRI